MCRLMTSQLEEALKGFPLYSQDGKGKEAICRAIFALGGVRWFILEGEKEGNDTVLFGIVVGLIEDEYGYFSLYDLYGKVKQVFISIKRNTFSPCLMVRNQSHKWIFRVVGIAFFKYAILPFRGRGFSD